MCTLGVAKKRAAIQQVPHTGNRHCQAPRTYRYKNSSIPSGQTYKGRRRIEKE